MACHGVATGLPRLHTSTSKQSRARMDSSLQASCSGRFGAFETPPPLGTRCSIPCGSSPTCRISSKSSMASDVGRSRESRCSSWGESPRMTSALSPAHRFSSPASCRSPGGEERFKRSISSESISFLHGQPSSDRPPTMPVVNSVDANRMRRTVSLSSLSSIKEGQRRNGLSQEGFLGQQMLLPHTLPARKNGVRPVFLSVSAKKRGGHAKFADSDTAQVPEESLVSCTTFNILAPIYKRLGAEEKRESQMKDAWMSRNRDIVDMLLENHTSIICLQEFWLGSQELNDLYEERLGKAGYSMHKVGRTNNRGDGLMTAIDTNCLEVLDHQDVLFNDCGDRVAQLLHVRTKSPVVAPASSGKGGSTGEPSPVEAGHPEMLIVNTHLLFPHSSTSCVIRLRQVYKILEYLEQYRTDLKLPPMPIILCGDWNGSKRGQVYKFLRSQGFVSSYDHLHEYEDNSKQPWVSHRNHRGNLCGVDFIWLLNPSAQTRPLTADWKAAVFRMIKAKLSEEGLNGGEDAFNFFQSDGDHDDYVTPEEFQSAIDQLGLTGGAERFGLTPAEINELVQCADADGNGRIDYEEFQRSFAFGSLEEVYERIKEATGITEMPGWSPPGSPTSEGEIPMFRQPRGASGSEDELHAERSSKSKRSSRGGFGLSILESELYPPEAADGHWPEGYALSDHAKLTTVFAPMVMSQK